jgi:hypothetical protein
MVNGLHVPIYSGTGKSLAIALSRVGRGLRGRNDRGNVNNVQRRSDQICHYESTPPYNDYSLIKISN